MMDDDNEQEQSYDADGCYDWHGHGLHCGDCLERHMVEREEVDPCILADQRCMSCGKRMEPVREIW